MKKKKFLLRLAGLMFIAVFVFSNAPVIAQGSEDVAQLKNGLGNCRKE